MSLQNYSVLFTKKEGRLKTVAALERYDGPAFHVLRKFIIECPAEARNLDIHILSAKFGLITAARSIPRYEQNVTWTIRPTCPLFGSF